MLSVCDASGLTLEKLSNTCFEMLVTQLYTGNNNENTDWIRNGKAPVEESFRNFTYNGETLTIYFEPYEVAPYALGTLQVKLKPAK